MLFILCRCEVWLVTYPRVRISCLWLDYQTRGFTEVKLGDFTAFVSLWKIDNAWLWFYSVNIPPLITLEPPKDVQFREDEAIELPCKASGNPPPVYVSYIIACLNCTTSSTEYVFYSCCNHVIFTWLHFHGYSGTCVVCVFVIFNCYLDLFHSLLMIVQLAVAVERDFSIGILKR